MNNRGTCNSSGIRGYTLIETAIVISVVGVLIGSFFSAYSLYLQRKIQNTTELNSTLITSAMSNFLIQKGRFPCPSRIDALRDDSDYGIESQCDPTQASYPIASNPGSASSAGTFNLGLWYESSLTMVDIDPNPAVTNIVTPKVRRGGVPFRTLALPEDRSFDGYGNRFTYAVTEPQAVTSSYQKGNGGIMIYNAANQPFFRVQTDTDKIFLRPDSTLSNSLWSPTSSPHLVVDDVTENNGSSERIYSNNSTQATIVMSLSNPVGIVDPTGNSTLRFRYVKNNFSSNTPTSGGNSGTLEVRVYTDSTLTTQIASWSNTVPSSASWQGPVSITFANSLVPNWNNVTLWVQHRPAATGTKRGVAISYFELDVDRLPGVFIDYFLFSSGKDQAGAYSRWGQLVKPCPSVGLDQQNCDVATQAIYRMTDRADGTGATHFDDGVKFFNSIEVPLWRISGTGAHIRDLLNLETSGGKIAIKTAPDTAPAAPILQVSGEVRANGSNAMVGQICDIADTNCFPASNLADPVTQATDFTCPAGQYAQGFEFGKIKCTPDQYVPCASGQVVTGIAPDGTLECTSVVGCPATTIPLCYNTTTGSNDTTVLPSGIQGQNYITPSSGYNYQETWTCGPNPWWTRTGTTGICNCAPVDETYDVPCNNVWSGNWTGNVTMHHVHTCPANTDSVTQVSNTCVCVDRVETYTDYAGCGTGFSGSITYQRTWSCSSGTAGAWSSWTVAPGGNTCACTGLPSETRDRTCATGSTGIWKQARDFTCPAGTWTAWYDTTNTCTCQNGSQDGPYNVGCPAGLTGTKTKSRYFDCSTSNYGAWVYTDNCVCTPDTQTQTLSCPTAYSGAITQNRSFTCPAATWSAWTTTTNTCTCTGATEYRTIACAAPLAGTKDQRRDYDCGTNTWGSWTDTTNNCYVQSYNWTPKVSADGPFSTQLSVRAGDTCSTLNASTPCCAQAGGGLGWYHYAECKCE